MLKVGITGGIGSGKSLVCRVFESIGVPVYKADDQAKQLTDQDSRIREKLTALFGDGIYLKEGGLDRKKLASIIFHDKEALAKVNEIIHPVVRAHFVDWCEKYRKHPYVLQEAAILFESGLDKRLDRVIAITAPQEMRIERVMERDKATREDVLARIRNQMPEEEKVSRSDFVIVNDGQELLLPQILQIDKDLRKMSRN